MIKLILTQIKHNKPFVSISLIISCCIATIPQFILGNNFSFLTGQEATLNSFYLIALNAFTHSPEMLLNHFIGNLLVIIIFGTLTETLIGSKRFAFISLISFFLTTSINYLHSTGGSSHGVSGIVWGYHLIFIIFLITYIKEKGYDVFKDLFVLFTIFLLIFDLFGIMLLEVLVQHLRFFQNFGQVLHIISLISVVPLMILWKKDLSANIRQYLLNKPIEFSKPKWGVGMVLIFLLVSINFYGTIRVLYLNSHIDDKYIDYQLDPPIGTRIDEIKQTITIAFDKDICKTTLRRKSMLLDDELPKVSLQEKWNGEDKMEISFDRKFIESESLYLQYDVETIIEDNLRIKQEILLEYD